MSRKCDFGVLPFNWRDVGIALHSLGEAGFLPAGRLLRCGLVDYQHWEDMGKPLTIINLRPAADSGPLGVPGIVQLCHRPIDDNADHIGSLDQRRLGMRAECGAPSSDSLPQWQGSHWCHHCSPLAPSVQ
mmetsp:Transcript_63890/g.114012  ORF Transcript_63890/g.114012 Transcript_63890/m.114012 type:complete len:130 (+) Transcript_63890:144-533(+)